MAHANCGAVAAAIKGGDAGKNLNHLLSYIQPAIDTSEDVDVVARRNAALSAKTLEEQSDILRRAADNDSVATATAFFNFTTGAVEFD
jgi:carbonic anhydrase